jgi:hypothetical protein
VQWQFVSCQLNNWKTHSYVFDVCCLLWHQTYHWAKWQVRGVRPMPVSDMGDLFNSLHIGVAPGLVSFLHSYSPPTQTLYCAAWFFFLWAVNWTFLICTLGMTRFSSNRLSVHNSCFFNVETCRLRPDVDDLSYPSLLSFAFHTWGIPWFCGYEQIERLLDLCLCRILMSITLWQQPLSIHRLELLFVWYCT